MVEAYPVRSSLVLFVGVLITIGCATGQTSRSFRPDIRESVAIGDPKPRFLLAGPARLLHLDVERRGPVVVYRVLRRDGTVADCQTDGVEGSAIVEITHGSLDVMNDESLCVTVGRHATLSWHAQSLTETPEFAQGRGHASLH